MVSSLQPTNNPPSIDQLWKVARFLFDLSKQYRVPEQFTDGAFYLTFFEPTFVPRVRRIRLNLWHTEQPPLANEPMESHWPFNASRSPIPYRAPDWTAEQSQWFLDQVGALEEIFGLPGTGAEVILYGVPSIFPLMKYIEKFNLFTESEPHIELRIFSARLTGKHVASVYEKEISRDRLHLPRFSSKRTRSPLKIEWDFEYADIPALPCIVLRIHPPWPKSSVIVRTYLAGIRAKDDWTKQLYCGRVSRIGSVWGKQPAQQGVTGQIRTWTIFIAEKKLGLPIREALRQFHWQFPDEGYSRFDVTAAETQYADIRYQKERKLLLRRLPFLA